jgi:hypothetical protein
MPRETLRRAGLKEIDREELPTHSLSGRIGALKVFVFAGFARARTATHRVLSLNGTSYFFQAHVFDLPR